MGFTPVVGRMEENKPGRIIKIAKIRIAVPLRINFQQIFQSG
jgi:hypothetical protein